MATRWHCPVPQCAIPEGARERPVAATGALPAEQRRPYPLQEDARFWSVQQWLCTVLRPITETWRRSRSW